MSELVGIRSSGDLSLGSTLAIVSTADGGGGVAIALLVAPASAQIPIVLPVVAQPIWSTLLFQAAGGLTNAANEWLHSIPVPTVPSLAWQAFEFQSARLASGRVQLSPPLGGVVLP